ncbi:HNH endonuclease family protein [Clostridium sp. DMHC 10]|uniref:HNH endonuclease family protein n=1 Tax=Clostridium sp. DMHC 10 TaxID=747377 RepID=UPI00069F8F7B|nr:HNH endonuclease family protein [Clostridium sp. DMHC 10]
MKGKDFIEYLNDYKAIYEKLILDKDVLNGNSEDIEYKNLLNIMTDFLPSTDWIPPILYYYKRFKEENIFEFVKVLEKKFAADWILGATSTKRVVNMNSILRKIEMSSRPEEIIRSEVMGFEKDALKDKINGDMYNESYCKYVLLKLEYLESEHNIERKYNTISVEHVMPQNINNKSKWKSWFDEEKHIYWKHKIANLILLSKRKNSSASNYEFEIKREKYFKGRISDLTRSQKVLTYTEWTCKVLEKRQEDILKLLLQ